MDAEQQPEAPAIPGVTRWRKKPIVITAIQFTGANVSEIWDAFGAAGIYGPTEKNPDHLILTTVHGDEAPARAGDWIIPDAAPDTFYPCKPDVFAATYEPAVDAQDHAGGNWRELIADALADITGIAEADAAADAVMAVIRPLAELEDALESGTSCTRCAATLDLSAAQTVRRETAEAKLTEIAGECRDTIRYPATSEGEMLMALAILAITGTEEETGNG